MIVMVVLSKCAQENPRLPMTIDVQVFSLCVPYFGISKIDSTGNLSIEQNTDFRYTSLR